VPHHLLPLTNVSICSLGQCKVEMPNGWLINWTQNWTAQQQVERPHARLPMPNVNQPGLWRPNASADAWQGFSHILTTTASQRCFYAAFRHCSHHHHFPHCSLLHHLPRMQEQAGGGSFSLTSRCSSSSTLSTTWCTKEDNVGIVYWMESYIKLVSHMFSTIYF
jgi:hypothetical protein